VLGLKIAEKSGHHVAENSLFASSKDVASPENKTHWWGLKLYFSPDIDRINHFNPNSEFNV